MRFDLKIIFRFSGEILKDGLDCKNSIRVDMSNFYDRYSASHYANTGCHINKSGNVIEFGERELWGRIHLHDKCQWHSVKRRHRINFGQSRGGWEKLTTWVLLSCSRKLKEFVKDKH
ncbi:hypothetical protein CEXT_456821 [Caerostris extrusa]|uniref:Uncharacterized protein n=1 Tax=Caerostris extrusa TaxID=172846 RepID=A0AAV4UKW1_CAEEX|nr:hypothetical protein CEXT_456821 [Caerostris extrusa]